MPAVNNDETCHLLLLERLQEMEKNFQQGEKLLEKMQQDLENTKTKMEMERKSEQVSVKCLEVAK